MSSLRPAQGARFLLDRDGADGTGGSARYRGGVYTRDSEHCFVLVLAEDGSATIESADGEADAEHVERLLDLARSTARAAARRRSDGLSPWPDRVVRWRGPGRG
jgi:hypothetical protein